MTRMLVVLSLLCAIFSSITQVHAEGALASGWDKPGGRGWYGLSTNLATVAEAEAAAIRFCRQSGPYCWITARFNNTCAALALTTTGNGQILGYGDTIGAAQAAALANCRKTFSGSSCKLGIGGCDVVSEREQRERELQSLHEEKLEAERLRIAKLEEQRQLAAKREAEGSAKEARRHAAEAEAQRRAEEERRLAAEAHANRTAEEITRLAALLKEGRGADAPLAPTTPLGRRVALVFGNSNYKHAPRLANPANDARAIATFLRRLGFADVVEQHDLGRIAMEEALKVFGDKSTNSDWAVIYYAGHGVQMDGRSFLLPIDARLARTAHVEDEAIALDRMVSKVGEARKLRLVILDACRSNPFVASMLQDGRITRRIGRGLARVEPPSGVLIAYAARDGQEAEDGEGENSPFTAALIQHLEEPGLEINMLFRKVWDSVVSKTRGSQEPFVYGSLPSEGFYFKHAQIR